MTADAGADRIPCHRPGCEGLADCDGYCDVCGFRCRPAYTATAWTGFPSGAVRPSLSSTPSRPTTGPSTDQSSRAIGARGDLGAGLVTVDPVPERDATSMVLADPHVPAARRTCSRCGSHLGGDRDGRPARPDGFCTVCGQRFSFTPKLVKGDLVAGQYLVAGCLAHGGMGWLYLAQDQRLHGRWSVLKGLLDTADSAAMNAAIAERQYLSQVSHTNIVEVYNFVDHAGDGYIVMEYVGGQSLRDIRRSHSEQTGEPLPLTVALAYSLEILSALGFLHSRGLLYCDLKPDNVIQTGELLKVIDLGAVCRIDDHGGDIYGTTGYQAPEVRVVGPSVSSDLYTVGRLLAVLALDFRGYQDESRFATSLPPASAVPLFTRYPSFHRLLLRATDPDPASRFASAAEMSEQMLGVLRQVVADQGRPVPAVSSRCFSGERAFDPDRPSWRTLPVPLADPDDEAEAIVINLSSAPPEQVLAALSAAPETAEVRRRRARALLECGDPGAARAELDDAGPAGTGQRGTGALDWRTRWWAGVAAVVDGDTVTGRRHLEAVAAWLPGELAPQLALGLCAEIGGASAASTDLAQARVAWTVAAQYYEVARATDPALGGAAFGSSRVHQHLGHRDMAVEALAAVPATSSTHAAAQVRLCRVLCRAVGDDPPTRAHLERASALHDALAAGDLPAASRLELRRDLLLAAHGLLRAEPGAVDGLTVTGVACTERTLRGALDSTLRELASLSTTAKERIALIDEANFWRPWTRT